MNNELSTRKHTVVMKSGVALFVEQATAENLARELLNATAHNFIRIKELGELINSAEIAAVYTPEKYADYLRVKGGEHQCSYGRWHKKLQVCECESEMRKEREQKMAQLRRDEENRPATPEERAQAQEWIRKNRQIMEAKSVLAKSKRAGLRRTALTEYERKHGQPYNVPAGVFIIEDEELPA